MDCFEFFNYANIFFQKIGVRSKIRFFNIWQKKKKNVESQIWKINTLTSKYGHSGAKLILPIHMGLTVCNMYAYVTMQLDSHTALFQCPNFKIIYFLKLTMFE